VAVSTLSGTPDQTRIALVQQGDPARPGAWSGVPAGLASGLRAAGCEVVPIDAEFAGAAKLGRGLRMSWADQAASRAFAAACSATAKRRLRAAGPLDGAVVIGSGYSLSAAVPFVTFEDMTVAQAVRQPEPVYEALGDSAARRWQARQRHNYEASIGCCVASRWAASSVQADYGIPEAKVHVVGLGCNIAVEPVSRDWSSPRFLFVGVDWRRKRGGDVVEAFAEVRRSNPDATLDLVGRHDPVEMTGVTDHGLLPLDSAASGRRYAELLCRATCLVMPSTFEPFGIAYLDAAMAGIPSIGTTVGGAEDAIGGCGRVVDPGDQGALVAAMTELSDPETARALGERARTRAPEITWQAVAARVLGVFG
jgi:glycosyltransferase involved in cell wall biosynthesis